MPDPRSLCLRCGADKELALGRCAGCGHVPAREEGALSVLLSSRMLSPGELDEVQARLRRGEPLRPSRARLEEASALLLGGGGERRSLSRAEALGLLVVGVVLTPIVPAIYAWTWRDHPAARAAWAVAGVALGLDGLLWAGILNAAR